MTSNQLDENHLHHKCGRGTDPLENWRSAVSNNTYEKGTFYKIVKSTAELIYRCAGGVQVARRAPCASHTAEPAGGIALKCPPDQQMLEPGESVDRFQI